MGGGRRSASAPASAPAVTVLITSGRVPLALELARALWRAGARVVVADSFPVHMCSHSRAVAATVPVAAPRADPQQFTKDVLDIVEREGVDVVVPVCEEALYLAEVRDDLARVCVPVLDGIDSLEPLHNKATFVEIARQLGFAVPETIVATSPQPVAVGARTTAHGAVLKPAYSRGGLEATLVDASTGQVAVPGATVHRPWVVQEHIEGRDVCALAFVADGQVVVSATYHPTVTLGTNSVCFEAIRLHEVDRWLSAFARRDDHRGFFAFDFRETPAGRLYPIECNPRITNGIHLLEPAAIAQAVLGGRGGRVTSRRRRPRTRARVTLGVLAAAGSARSPRALASVLRNARGAREVTWDWRDPVPAVAQLSYNVHVMRVARRHGLDLSEAIVHELDWNGRCQAPSGASSIPAP